MRFLNILALLTLAIALPACGSGGGSIGAAIAEGLAQMFPEYDPDLSGSVSSDGLVREPNAERAMMVGDDNLNESWRGYMTYNLPEARPGYVLEKAEIWMSARRFIGFPIRDLGSVYVQKVNIGATLDRFDYNRSATGWTRAFATRDLDTHTPEVTRLVQQSYDDGDSRITLRFRSLDSDGDLDGRSDLTYFNQVVLILNWRRIP